MKGLRKFYFGAFSILSTIGALWLCLLYGEAGKILFPSYATFAAGVTAGVIIGNVGEHLAKRGQP